VRRLVLVFFVFAAACGGATHGRTHTYVVSAYPVEWAVRNIVGEDADVLDLAPAGVEPHDFELGTRDVDAISDAKFVFYIGSGFQPAVATAAKRRSARAVDVSAGLVTRDGDPHFWLDPTRMAKSVRTIADALGPRYREDATELENDLAQLDADFATGLKHCQRKEIVTAHASFGYLAARYGLTQRALSGISPESEPSPNRLADLSATIKRDGITTVFYERLVPRAIADTLAREAGVNAALLDPVETLTKQQRAAGDDYFSVMRRNLVALKAALGCT
jgi:zinc transport system substrate-binding protein